jgi:hypothetical protein
MTNEMESGDIKQQDFFPLVVASQIETSNK